MGRPDRDCNRNRRPDGDTTGQRRCGPQVLGAAETSVDEVVLGGEVVVVVFLGSVLVGAEEDVVVAWGVVVVVAAISPYRDAREQVKAKIAKFVEVHVDCSIEVLTERDTKGLYKRALAGELANFTGISDPYEPPLHPSVVIHSDRESVDDALAKIWRELEARKLVR